MGTLIDLVGSWVFEMGEALNSCKHLELLRWGNEEIPEPHFQDKLVLGEVLLRGAMEEQAAAFKRQNFHSTSAFAVLLHFSHQKNISC